VLILTRNRSLPLSCHEHCPAQVFSENRYPPRLQLLQVSVQSSLFPRAGSLKIFTRSRRRSRIDIAYSQPRALTSAISIGIPPYLRPPAPKRCGDLLNKSSVMPLRSPTLSNNYEPVSPVDITANPKRTRSVGFAPQADDKEDSKVTTRSIRTNSSSSITLNTPRKARFVEATSVLSPASGPGEHKSPFRDPKMAEDGPKPSDVGFGYIADNEPREQYATIRTDNSAATGQPLKSALKTPGTASRLLNPLSPTFREEVQLEKQEESTEKEQAKDLVSGFMHDPSTTVTDNHSRKSRPEYAWPRWSFAVSTSPAR
jgi:hypothetical protein